MTELYRLQGGTHRRPAGDGEGEEVFEDGDVIEPSDDELAAIGDKLEPVDEAHVTEDGSVEEPSGTSPTGEYRLLEGKHKRLDGSTATAGDVVELTDAGYRANRDRFEPIETSEESDDETETEAGEAPFHPMDFTVSEFREEVEEVESADALDALADLEASEDNRSGVQDAIDVRRDALAED